MSVLLSTFIILSIIFVICIVGLSVRTYNDYKFKKFKRELEDIFNNVEGHHR